MGGITAVACFTVVAFIPGVACIPAVVGGLDIAVILKRPGSLKFFFNRQRSRVYKGLSIHVSFYNPACSKGTAEMPTTPATARMPATVRMQATTVKQATAVAPLKQHLTV